jgi:hypothetical protein
VRDIYLQSLGVGEMGELVAYTWLRELAEACSDHCSVEWTSRENEGAGYDFLVSSQLIFTKDELPKRFKNCRVEVKGSSGENPDNFYISRNEYFTMNTSKSDGFEYVILLISDLGNGKNGFVHSLVEADAILSENIAMNWTQAQIPFAGLKSKLRTFSVRVPIAATDLSGLMNEDQYQEQDQARSGARQGEGDERGGGDLTVLGSARSGWQVTPQVPSKTVPGPAASAAAFTPPAPQTLQKACAARADDGRWAARGTAAKAPIVAGGGWAASGGRAAGDGVAGLGCEALAGWLQEIEVLAHEHAHALTLNKDRVHTRSLWPVHAQG